MSERVWKKEKNLIKKFGIKWGFKSLEGDEEKAKEIKDLNYLPRIKRRHDVS